jgi:hypothetical protein
MAKVKLKIVATNASFSKWLDKEFEAEASTNSIGCHLFKLNEESNINNEIYFNKGSEFRFSKNGLILEGFAQIGFNLGQISILFL